MMSSSCLEADLSALASTIRARLQKHRSHQLKVGAYRWLDTTLVEIQAFALARLRLGDNGRRISYSNSNSPFANAGGPGQELTIESIVSAKGGVDVILARVGR